MLNLPWFALSVKTRHEKYVALNLERKGYQTYLPTYTHRVKHGKAYQLPLFSTYVFCRLDLAERLTVIMTPGVFSIVGGGSGKPESIAESEIDSVREALLQAPTAVPWTYLHPGQEITINHGALKGVRGQVVHASDGKWLVVSVNLLRRSVAVKLEYETLSVAISSEYKVPSVKTNLGGSFVGSTASRPL